MKKICLSLFVSTISLVMVLPVTVKADTFVTDTQAPSSIRAQLRSDYENRINNARNNRDIRNEVLTREESTATNVVTFESRKNDIVRQLTISLDNLRRIRARGQSRIDKAAADGLDMTDANHLLIAADAKIQIAQDHIDAVSALSESSSLDRPRQMVVAAVSAIKDAQKSLGDVVAAIAEAMGIKL